jgi:hypothetical protein
LVLLFAFHFFAGLSNDVNYFLNQIDLVGNPAIRMDTYKKETKSVSSEPIPADAETSTTTTEETKVTAHPQKLIASSTKVSECLHVNEWKYWTHSDIPPASPKLRIIHHYPLPDRVL